MLYDLPSNSGNFSFRVQVLTLGKDVQQLVHHQ